MGTGLIFAGFLFLLNPDLFTFDILPDLVGYLLISAGLKKLAFLEDRVATARRFFHYLAVVSAAKIASVPMVITTTVESTRLTVCFAFFVVEIWLSYIAAANAMKGVQYLAIRKDGNLALKGFETARFFLVGFGFVKHVANFLPPSTAIFFPNIDADPDVVESVRRPFMTVRTILFAIGVVALLSFGIYSARVLRAYLGRCRSDEVFCRNLRKDYEEKVSKNESMQIRLALKNAFFWFFFAFIFLADLYLDDIGFFPTFLFPLSVFLGFRSLERVTPVSPWGKRVSFVAFAISCGTYVYRTLRLILMENPAEFSVSFVQDPLARLLGVLSGVLVFASAVFMILGVRKCAEVHTSHPYKWYGIAIVIASFVLCDLGFAQYLFPSTFAVLPSVQWVIWAVSLYLHKKSLDEIREEIDYKLM